jgi:molybdopterin-containing oxidoreductase family iron-sulfur binding subunit
MDKKLDITHLIKDEASDSAEQPTYWRSFRELYNDPEFDKAVKQEFSEEVTKDFDLKGLSAFSRRKFLALLSASAAFAAAGCYNGRDKGEIIPYNKKPEEIIPGIPNYYASTCTGCSEACGTLVKTREGRPIKVDGNPDHPVNKGKICPRGQASIMNLYDPARIKEPQFNTGGGFTNTSWENADEKILAEIKNAVSSGKEIAVISHTINSPSTKAMLDEFIKAFPVTKVYSYEYINNSNGVNALSRAYGKREFPVVKLYEANIIVAMECDFLGTEGSFTENTRMFAETRDAVSGSRDFSRLYAIEGSFSLTGANADYRIRIRPDAIEEFALALINEFAGKRKVSALSGDTNITSASQNHSLDAFISKYNLNANYVKHLIEDISANQGKTVFLAGSKLSESAHVAVNMLNEVVGGSKLFSTESTGFEVLPLSTKQDIETLIGNMNADKVGVVIHFGSNPAYHFAPDYGYISAIAKVPMVVTLTDLPNESMDVCKYVLPINHDLESWGDFKTRTGFYSLQQPVIAPLYNTRQKEAILLNWLKGGFNDKLYRDYVMSGWEKSVYTQAGSPLGFKQYWNTALHDGVVTVNESTQSAPADTTGQTTTSPVIISAAGYKMQNTGFFGQTVGKTNIGNDFCLVINPTINLGDGRFANNGWLQELPHPLSKLVWDNYAAVSPATAAEFGLNNNDLIEIDVEGRKVTLPVFIQAGLADRTIETQLGYGRRRAGEVGSNIGVDVTLLMSKNAAHSDRMYSNAKISKAGGTYELVTTQEHYAMDNPRYQDLHEKREIIIERTYNDYKKDPKLIKHELKEEQMFSISKEHLYQGVKWGMSIDLNKCTGCSACTVACYAENNIPVVGKDQVKLSREMAWIRIDRYYSGTPEEPKVSMQPMTCQHCDNAPCENVCPVVATNHSPDGLNQMVYNRCVGTKYCSNNCPYKVRRFNFYDFRDHLHEGYYKSPVYSLMSNPEVTVRSRGVMEKCTFCIQRIMEERQHATEQNRGVDGDKVTTACQDACPANAIVFGDYVVNKDSLIRKYREHDLGYHVIEETNTRPNVTYIAQLRNINPENS